MSNQFDRKDFLKISSAAMGGAMLTSMGLSQISFAKKKNVLNQDSSIRLGFVGIGGRGQWHLSSALGIPGVQVPAICEIKPERLYTAKRWVEESGQPSPTLYGADEDETAFKRMCEEEDLDAIICSTSWKWHAPIVLAAMNNDKHVACEVPLMLTLDEAWEIIETHESTGNWASTVLGGFPDVTLLNMIRRGLLGDMIHAEGGYIHDLRFVKHAPDEEPWRLWHSIYRNGNLYPDHPMRTIMPALDINHGDRIDYLISMSSKAVMLNDYAADQYGKEHPYATKEMKQGDYNASLIRTVDGKMITLNFDTNTPHPRGNYRFQGTKGVYLRDRGTNRIYVEGQSPESHEWEPAEKYRDEYESPILKNYDPPERVVEIRGHGGSNRQTSINWTNLVEAIRNDTSPYIDTYDSVTSSAVSAVTEQSIAEGCRPVDFPDFTRGKWQNRTPILATA